MAHSTPQSRLARSRAANKARWSRPLPTHQHPATSDQGYTDEEAEFLAAIEAYRNRVGRRFPTNCELLAVLKGLGYRKVAS